MLLFKKMMVLGEPSDRRGSVSSIGSAKRRRGVEEEEGEDMYASWRREVDDFIFTDSNKISRAAARYILGAFARYEQDSVALRT